MLTVVIPALRGPRGPRGRVREGALLRVPRNPVQQDVVAAAVAGLIAHLLPHRSL